jgi:hypothetical protein
MTIIRLTNWRIVRHIGGANHLNGRVENTTRGRLSTPIIVFDRETMTAKTWSGNTYILVGEPSAFDHASCYVLNICIRKYGLTPADFTFIPVEDLNGFRFDEWLAAVQSAKTYLIFNIHGTLVVSDSDDPATDEETCVIELPTGADPGKVEAEAKRPASDLWGETKRWLRAMQRSKTRRSSVHADIMRKSVAEILHILERPEFKLPP